MFPLEAVISHRDAVAGVDRDDLIATLAGLQLVPANADRLLRLEGGVQSVASLPGGPTRRITRSELRAWLDRTPFAIGEDPFNNSLVEELPFIGGSYRVLPGLTDGSAYLLRRLGEAIFLRDDFGVAERFRVEASALIVAALRVSDRVCRLAELKRGTHPGSGPLVVPAQRPLDDLKRAVTVEERDLAELLHGLPVDLLDLLTQEVGVALTTEPEHLGDGPFYARPLIRLEDGTLIVALPHALLGALLHAVVLLAVEHVVIDRLAAAFRSAVFASVIKSLSFVECPRLNVPLSAAPEGFVDAVCALDGDKAVYVLVVTDPLTDYDPQELHGPWRDDDLAERIERRLLEVEEELFFSGSPPHAILHLVIVQSIGRRMFVGFGPRLEPVRSYRVLMSAAELDTISLLEGGRDLTLWQHARAADRLRDNTHVLAWGKLDEFDVYRRNRDYYLSDDERPTTLSVGLGGAAKMLAEVADRFDFHGAQTPSGGVAEVTLLHGERRIPIYVPYPPGGGLEVLVEGLPVPAWVVPAEAEFDRRYRAHYAQFADVTSYWVWQLAPEIGPWLGRLTDSHELFIIELELVGSDGWFAGEPAAEDSFEYSVVEPNRLRLTFRAAVTDCLAGATNAGEREIVSALVRAIAEAAGVVVELREGEEIVDRRAPLGQKKKISTFRTTSDPRLDDTGLPSYRSVQAADTSEALDEVGAHLVDTLGYTVGPITSRDAQRDVLNEVTDFHFRQLEQLVATLEPVGLMEWLVATHEAIVAHQTLREFQVPSELACFSTSREMVERLAREIPEASQAAISSRFLIEYVAAKPPSGIRPMSLSVYDRLLALASEVFNRGTLSDLIHHELADADISILPSKRLGVDQATVHGGAREQFLGAHAAAELEQRINAYARIWAPPVDKTDPPEEIQALDEAIEGELGIRLTELVAFHIETINLGFTLNGEPKLMEFDALRQELVRVLGWEEARVDRSLELSLLSARDNFLLPPDPFEARDVYPWRFDRRLSYSRRPLIRRVTDNGDEIIWGNRHLYAASRYFFGLCTNGHLEAQTLQLRQVMSRRRSADARAFNDRVAALLRQRPNTIVGTRVTKFGRTRIEKARGQLISDIDVFVADLQRREFLLIETKDLAVARTPAELANELRELYRGRGGSAAVDRLLDVLQWVRGHRQDVLASFGLDTKDFQRWRVRPLVVVDQELLTPYLVDITVPTLSYRTLSDRVARGRLH